MKTIITIILLVLLTGCGSEEGAEQSPTANPTENVPKKEKEPALALTWDLLACQKESNCQNKVLNPKYEVLILQLENRFEYLSSDEEGSIETTFYCGSDFFDFWQESFPGERLETIEEQGYLSELAFTILEVSTCQLKKNLESNLKTYLENTKEYKNEINNI